MERLPPLISIFGFALEILSPITLIPGNLPTITSSNVVAAGEIDNFAEGLDILLFCVPHEHKIKKKIKNLEYFKYTVNICKRCASYQINLVLLILILVP